MGKQEGVLVAESDVIAPEQWPIGVHDAKRQQEEAAARHGVPVERVLELGHAMTMEMVLIPDGSFAMGSPESEGVRSSNEGPLHPVNITRALYMSKYAVTQAQYRAVRGGGRNASGDGSHPVVNVSWRDAAEFCTHLYAMVFEAKVRLPTEAEWEYACRAGTASPYNFGDSISADLANFDASYECFGAIAGERRGRTLAVGQFAPNAWGLYDMHGNVWEWCADGYDSSYYARSPGADPQGPAVDTTDPPPETALGKVWRMFSVESSAREAQAVENVRRSKRVLRGGSWSSIGIHCRSAYRHRRDLDAIADDVGFRIVVELPRA